MLLLGDAFDAANSKRKQVRLDEPPHISIIAPLCCIRYFSDGLVPDAADARAIMVCSPIHDMYKVRPRRHTALHGE